MRDQGVVAAFGSKILGVRNYKSEKKEFLVGDFCEPAILKKFLLEVSTGESDMTPAGKAFLDKYYGFEALALEIAKPGDFALDRRPSTSKEILEWLYGIEPMRTISFIEEARGNIKPETRLRADLLPPDDL
jgi:hypothetical protein